MRGPSARVRRGLGFLALVGLAAGRPRPARAMGVSGGDLAGFAAAAILIPSETGATFVSEGPRFVLGWSLQLPHDNHRAVLGLNLVPDGGDHRVEGRLGYRYAAGRMFGGLGVTLDPGGVGWSPEIGFTIFPWHGFAETAGVHFLVRGQFAAELDRARGVSVLFGWTFL